MILKGREIISNVLNCRHERRRRETTRFDEVEVIPIVVETTTKGFDYFPCLGTSVNEYQRHMISTNLILNRTKIVSIETRSPVEGNKCIVFRFDNHERDYLFYSAELKYVKKTFYVGDVVDILYGVGEKDGFLFWHIYTIKFNKKLFAV